MGDSRSSRIHIAMTVGEFISEFGHMAWWQRMLLFHIMITPCYMVVIELGRAPS